MSTVAEADLSLDDVMARRFELDAEIALIEGRHKAELEPLKEEQRMCEQFLQQHMVEQGLQQLKTDAGMTYFNTVDSVTVEDFDIFIPAAVVTPPPMDGYGPEQWSAVVAHVIANSNWGLLNNAANKTAVKEFIEANKQPPPGIKYTAFRKLAWRRGRG